VAKNREAIAVGRWQLNRLPPPKSAVFYKLELLDHPDNGQPPSLLEYHAVGAGHFFARDSWGDDATLVYLTAGVHDEAHQQEDQGAFGVWSRGEWQTSSDSPWTKGGIAQDVSYQNVLRFPEAKNIRHSISTLSWRKTDGLMKVDMDLSPAVGRTWLRSVEWRWGCDCLRITDVADGGEFGFEKPGIDDHRAPSQSKAHAVTRQTQNGLFSVVTW
jgi:hypothetical protein